jgi:hypothetical protein
MKIAAVLVVLSACLVAASPAAAITPKQQIAKLRSQLALAKKANSRLVTQNDKLDGLYVTARDDLAAANAQLAKAGVDATTQSSALSTAQAQVATDQITITNLTSQVTAAAQTIVSGMNAVQLWQLLSSVNLRISQIGGTTYTTSAFTGSSFSSYDFDWFH